MASRGGNLNGVSVEEISKQNLTRRLEGTW
jgi:hypothetical protein